jgi:hypothetical protein
MNFCRGCGEDFASVAAFDRHRVGVHAYTFAQGLLVNPTVEDGRRCMDEEELYVVGMEIDSRGRWCITAEAERVRKAFARDPATDANHLSELRVIAQTPAEAELVV